MTRLLDVFADEISKVAGPVVPGQPGAKLPTSAKALLRVIRFLVLKAAKTHRKGPLPAALADIVEKKVRKRRKKHARS